MMDSINFIELTGYVACIGVLPLALLLAFNIYALRMIENKYRKILQILAIVFPTETNNAENNNRRKPK